MPAFRVVIRKLIKALELAGLGSMILKVMKAFTLNTQFPFASNYAEDFV
jgi:hypothetical protein